MYSAQREESSQYLNRLFSFIYRILLARYMLIYLLHKPDDIHRSGTSGEEVGVILDVRFEYSGPNATSLKYKSRKQSEQ